jgi:hypothetical protein
MAAMQHCIARQCGQNTFSPHSPDPCAQLLQNHDNTAKATSITFCGILDKQVRFYMGRVGKAMKF